jgi:hypothetical protein
VTHILQYPKLLGLALSFVFAYLLYHLGAFDLLEEALNGYGIISMVLGGMLFSFGFTAAFAVGMFVAMTHEVHPLIGAILGGLGACITDFLIFQFIRLSFLDELHRLKSTAVILRLRGWLHRETFPERLREYLFWSVGGLLIASPLPDEIGVTLLSSITEIDVRRFILLCFSLNALGIFAILSAARLGG